MALDHEQPTTSPGEHIREELRRRGWTQDDLSRVLDRPIGRVNEIISGKQGISPEIALDLAMAFSTTPDLWLSREAAYRLAMVKPDGDAVRRRARLFGLGPIKEMQKRGWLRATATTEDLEREVKRFYRLADIDEEPAIAGAMRKTNPLQGASPAQRAWAFRVRRLAEAIPAPGVYDESRIEACKRDVRKLAAYSAEVKKVPSLLAGYGIRYVVVEGLAGAKLDGFAFWLDDRSPVIAMSLKYDRLDSFWFTLGHELIHIQYRDESPIDGDVGGHDDLHLEVKPPMERRADAEGAAIFIPPDELESFINRAGPTYPLERINQFANAIKMHPSIIVGQLKGRGKLGYSRHTKVNAPVREAVIKTAVTDGWGKSIYPGVAE